VEDALAITNAAQLAGFLLGGAADEELLENMRGPLLRRDAHAAAIPRHVAAADDQGGETRLATEVRRHFLVERDAIADFARPNVIGMDAGKQANLGKVPGGVAMRHAREDREVLAVRLQVLQVAARLVVLAGLLREEERCVHAERTADE